MVPEPKPVGKNAAGTTLLAPAGVGVWSSPTVDQKRGVIYVATGNTYAGTTAEPTSDSLIALDPGTGAIKWTKQFTTDDVFGCRGGSVNCLEKSGPDFDFGTPAMLVTRKDGKDIILLGQKSGMAYAVDPDKQGELLWQYRAGEGFDLGRHPVGHVDRRRTVYIPVSDIRTPKPGGLHAVSLVDRRADLVSAAAGAEVHAGDANLQRRADLRTDAHPWCGVLGIQRRRPSCALDNGWLGDLGIRHQPGLHHAEQGPRERRRDPGSRADDCRRDALPERRIRRPHGATGQRACSPSNRSENGFKDQGVAADLQVRQRCHLQVGSYSLPIVNGTVAIILSQRRAIVPPLCRHVEKLPQELFGRIRQRRERHRRTNDVLVLRVAERAPQLGPVSRVVFLLRLPVGNDEGPVVLFQIDEQRVPAGRHGLAVNHERQFAHQVGRDVGTGAPDGRPVVQPLAGTTHRIPRDRALA